MEQFWPDGRPFRGIFSYNRPASIPFGGFSASDYFFSEGGQIQQLEGLLDATTP